MTISALHYGRKSYSGADGTFQISFQVLGQRDGGTLSILEHISGNKTCYVLHVFGQSFSSMLSLPITLKIQFLLFLFLFHFFPCLIYLTP